MDKQAIRMARGAAISLNVDLDDGDAVHGIIARKSGLFFVTRKKIVRFRSPDDLDPGIEHPDAPWEQSVYLPHGSSDQFVARTILQTEVMASMFFPKNSEKYLAMMDISWEVLNSLISLRVVRERLERRILESSIGDQ